MRKKGFTLIELLVVIAIIAILAAILFPVMASAKEKSRQTKCASNLKQLNMAVFRYCDDNSGFMPFACYFLQKPDWAGCLGTGENNLNHVQRGGLWDWVKNISVYSCPSGDKRFQLHYSMNGDMGQELWKTAIRGDRRKLDTESAGRASKILLFIHEGGNDGYFAWIASDIPSDIHNGGTSVSYCDGHIKFAEKKQLLLERNRGAWSCNTNRHLYL